MQLKLIIYVVQNSLIYIVFGVILIVKISLAHKNYFQIDKMQNIKVLYAVMRWRIYVEDCKQNCEGSLASETSEFFDVVRLFRFLFVLTLALDDIGETYPIYNYLNS